MWGKTILVGKHTERANIELGRRTQDSNSDFTTIGDEDLFYFMAH